MEEIAFRAFYKPDKKIYEVLNIDFEHKEVLLQDEKGGPIFRLNLDKVKLLEYTGLKTEFGLYKIYKGDVIKKAEWVSCPSGGGQIEWRYGLIGSVDGCLVFVSEGKITSLYDLRHSPKNIVGNIYTNPELTKLVNEGK